MRIRNILVPFVFIFGFRIPLFSQSFNQFINKDSIRASVEFLASDSFKGRFATSAGAMAAANFIAKEFEHAGLKKVDSSNGYFFPFKTPDSITTAYNVMGILPGEEPSSEVVIFSAHYDHLGTYSTNPDFVHPRKKYRAGDDTIFNGANDNASGTAALIALARYFGSLKNNKRSILFAAFSGEELGLVGSNAFAASLKNPSSVVCMINLEMLGRGEAPFITGSALGNLRPILNKELANIDVKQYGKHYFQAERFQEQQLFARSDNYPFALLSIPAYTIMCTSDKDQYYHTVKDEPQTLDYKKIEKITIAIVRAIEPIVNRGVNPWRIDGEHYDY